MPILTPTQKAALAIRLDQPDCANLSDQAAADLLNTPTTIANPSPQGQVPNPATLDPFALVGLLSPQSLSNLESAGMIGPIDAAILAKDLTTLAGWIRYAAQRGKITADEATAIDAALAANPATIPDPNWTATVAGPSWARANLAPCRFMLPDGSIVEGMVHADCVNEARA